MKWPRDNEAYKRRVREATDFGAGFLTGLFLCVVLSLIARNC